LEHWRWGSHHVRGRKKHDLHGLLAALPIELPKDCSRWVRKPQTTAQEEALRERINRHRSAS
jgi:hypothetical protein